MPEESNPVVTTVWAECKQLPDMLVCDGFGLDRDDFQDRLGYHGSAQSVPKRSRRERLARVGGGGNRGAMPVPATPHHGPPCV